MKKEMKFFGLSLLTLFWLTNLASANIDLVVTKAHPVGQFKVGIGSNVMLQSTEEELEGSATFLGQTLLPNEESSYQLYLNHTKKTLVYLPAAYAPERNTAHQTLIDSYQQTGGTCSAYAINNFLHQTKLGGLKGTGELQKLLTTEEGRSFLLADAINEYYLTLNHRYSIRGILDKYGRSFGFKCKALRTDTYAKAQKFILDHLQTGQPVVVSFNIGPDMVNGPFKLNVYNQNLKLDERLWIPRRVGERNSGGHTIVAVGSFVHNKKPYLVMVDSDWSEPRVWDMDEYLNHKKTALDEIEFVSCKE